MTHNSHQPHCLKDIDDIPLDKRKNICTHIDYSILRHDGYWDKLVKELEFNENDSKNFQLAFAKNQSPTENLLRECSYRNYKICTLSKAMKSIGLVKLAAENLENIEPSLPFKPLLPSPTDFGLNNIEKQGRTPTESDSSSSSHSCSESDKIGGFDTFHFSYEEIKKGTDNFSSAMKLGAGAFGKVYKVKLKNTVFACKVLTIDSETTHFSIISKHREHSDLRNELRYLAEYRHPNIIPLYGWSLDGKDPCLIYQYMKNGSLQDCLQRLKGNVSLKWPTRAKVACDAATGLQFLHTMKDKPLIHGDIKTANILLDESFVAKLGDFGLAREGPRSQFTGSYIKLGDEHTPGTIGYLAMEYMRSKKLSVQVDTYAFGVVLLELYTGRRAFDRSQNKKGVLLRDYMDDIANGVGQKGPEGADGQLYEHQDPEIEKLPRDIALKFVNLALECCHEKRNKRPPMLKALSRLEKIHEEILATVGPVADTPRPSLNEKEHRTQNNLDRRDCRPILSRNPVESVDHSLAPTRDSVSSLPHKDSNIYSPPSDNSIMKGLERMRIGAQGRNGAEGISASGRYESHLQRQTNVYPDYPPSPGNVFPSPIGQSPYTPYSIRTQHPAHMHSSGLLSPLGPRLAATQYMPQMADPAMSPVFPVWPPNHQPYSHQYNPNVVYPQQGPQYNQFYCDRQGLKLPTRYSDGFENLEPKANPTATTPVSPGTPWTPPEPFNSLDLSEAPFVTPQDHVNNVGPGAGFKGGVSNMGGYPVGVGQPGYQYDAQGIDTRPRAVNGLERRVSEETPSSDEPKPTSPRHRTMTVNHVKAGMLDQMLKGCEDFSQIFKSSPG